MHTVPVLVLYYHALQRLHFLSSLIHAVFSSSSSSSSLLLFFSTAYKQTAHSTQHRIEETGLAVYVLWAIQRRQRRLQRHRNPHFQPPPVSLHDRRSYRLAQVEPRCTVCPPLRKIYGFNGVKGRRKKGKRRKEETKGIVSAKSEECKESYKGILYPSDKPNKTVWNQYHHKINHLIR